MDTVPLPVSYGKADQILFFIQDLKLQEAGILKIGHEFPRLGLVMHTQDAWERRHLTDPLTWAFHVLLVTDLPHV